MFTSTCASNEWGLGYFNSGTPTPPSDEGYINDKFNGCVKNSCEATSQGMDTILDYGCEYEEIAKCVNVSGSCVPISTGTGDTDASVCSNHITSQNCIAESGCTFTEIEVEDPDIKIQQECSPGPSINKVWKEKKCWAPDDTEITIDITPLDETGSTTRSYTYKEKNECVNQGGNWRYGN